jgi:hypothetical protein
MAKERPLTPTVEVIRDGDGPGTDVTIGRIGWAHRC